jgi:hypothetical protein
MWVETVSYVFLPAGSGKKAGAPARGELLFFLAPHYPGRGLR